MGRRRGTQQDRHAARGGDLRPQPLPFAHEESEKGREARQAQEDVPSGAGGTAGRGPRRQLRFHLRGRLASMSGCADRPDNGVQAA